MVLARAHARSGQLGVISGYLGKSDRCDRAVTAFAMDYADQNERDYEALQRAVREGRIEVARESHDEDDADDGTPTQRLLIGRADFRDLTRRWECAHGGMV